METYNIVPLLKTLNERQDIFICGPSYGNSGAKGPNTKLRTYAYGGILCELPTKPRSEIKLLNKKYILKNSPLFMTLNELQGNEEKEKFLRDYLDDLLLCMKERFTSKSGACEERSQQTAISRDHTDFQRHNGTVVCDFQSSIPTACLSAGMSRPIFDMVTFSPNENTFTLVELKCTASSCGGENGLKKHADDMLRCVSNDSYREELLRRLGYMCEYGLLQNCPTGLEYLRPKELNLQAAFLFTSGTGLENGEKAAALCKEYIPEEDLDKFRYRFAESTQAVDLSHMESWSTFSSDQ